MIFSVCASYFGTIAVLAQNYYRHDRLDRDNMIF